MRQALTIVVLAALASSGTVRAQQRPQEIALQAAVRTETVAGDLKKAIQQYQEIIDKYGKTDRAAAANALVRMAECYQKLGDQQARALFERVVREFGDQARAAETARTRLASARPASERGGMVNKQIWTGAEVDTEGTISPDGRYLSYVHWDTGDLAIRDLLTGTNRRLTKKGTWQDSVDFAEESAISRDGSQVAYSWFSEKTQRYELRLLRTDATPATQPRVVLDNDDVEWIAPYDWSPDGKWIAIQLLRTDRTSQIGTVSVSDGSFKPLQSLDWRGTSRLSFSPDGSLLAYDVSESDGNGRDIFLLRVDGSRKMSVAPHAATDVVMGWSPDGSSFLFASDRSGTNALWSVAMVKGEPSGSPVMIKGDLGPLPSSMGITRSGTLVYGVRIKASTVAVASIDLETDKLLAGPTLPLESYASRISSPAWSDDGKLLVAVEELSRTRPGLTVATSEGKRLRQFALPMVYVQRLRWAPDGSLTAQGTDLKGQQGIFRIDPGSGQASLVIKGDPATGNLGQPAWTPDGKFLVFIRRNGSKGVQFVVRDMAAGTEKVLVDSPSASALSVSPDGTRIAYVLADRERHTNVLLTMPLAGGAPTEIARLSGTSQQTEWVPGGSHILFTVLDGATTQLWAVSTKASSAPRKLPIRDIGTGSPIRVHPDGRQIAYSTGSNAFEIWSLENFLQSAVATSTRR